MSKNTVIGYFDESSPQTTSNTQRMWSINKPHIEKNTTRIKANTFGIYSPNGNSTVIFRDHSRTDDVIAALQEFIDANPDKRYVVILDNFSSHRAKRVQEFANDNQIHLVYLPPYSPDLNPIEQIWKDIKREISSTFVHDVEYLRSVITEAFYNLSVKVSYAEGWINRFLSPMYSSKILCG